MPLTDTPGFGARKGVGRGPLLSALLAAALVTALNAPKPLVIDDTAYFYVARQIAAQPLDPYGFEIFWNEVPQPANHVLAPALLPYWWSIAISLFGDAPVLWKLWLFPFPVALAFGLVRLLARVAAPLATPLLWLAMLSPALCAGLNLMLDLPALALRILALALFVDACDRGGARWRGVAFAGLIAGLAMQTKYTGFLGPLLMLVYGACVGRLREASLAGAVAGTIFAGWEIFLLVRYGESHFLHSVGWVGGWAGEKPLVGFSLALASLLGGTAPAVGLLGLASLRCRASRIAAAGVAATLAMAVIPALDAEPFSELGARLPDFAQPRPELFLFLPLGLAILACTFAVGWRLLATGAHGAGGATPARPSHRLDAFLVAWVVLEGVGYYALSPAPAVRRVGGLTLAMILLAGRLAARDAPARPVPLLLRGVVAWGVALGLLFCVAELSDGLARRRVVELAVERLDTLGAQRGADDVWFLGHWGLQFHAERAGMRPLLPGRSRLEAGDWLLVPVGFVHPGVRIDARSVERMGFVSTRSPWPWSAIPSSYAGPIPIRRQPSRHVGLMIHRVTRPTRPERGPP